MNEEKLDKILNIVLENRKILYEHSKKFEEIDEKFRQVDERFEQVDERFEQIDEKFRQVDERFEQIDIHLNGHDDLLNEHSYDIASIKRTLLIIEDAVTNKIPALFDAYAAHEEKHEEFEARISHVENVSNTNSLKISILEDNSKIHSKQLKKLSS